VAFKETGYELASLNMGFVGVGVGIVAGVVVIGIAVGDCVGIGVSELAWVWALASLAFGAGVVG
jgi:hypothetical protein